MDNGKRGMEGGSLIGRNGGNAEWIEVAQNGWRERELIEGTMNRGRECVLL
ncbi:hypothetical protein DPMN_136711 [Dreissena polymorpha]|uniref:Uncharacterized protein n=1 Tax=Dreissena polymorpha TaxID=45954 RepID=A0A9D4G0J6_DREPO|nr:hypothetical protein DPMN_136711 [Dreissena polymorpha]